jgi:N-acetylglucosaminyldiphosphoundecaprenol N-acetyl-beta-D-mannosaminyltransferase
MPKKSRVQIGIVPIDMVTIAGAVEQVNLHLNSSNSRPFVISAVNAHFVNIAQKHPALASFLFESDLNVADGVSLVMASRFLRKQLPERVTGIDLMIELCSLAARNGRSVYLLGGMEGAAEGARVTLQHRFPALRILGVDRPPMGREFEPNVVQAVRERITNARPDFLFVCMGVPRQEFWIEAFTRDLPVKVVMGNGAAFDVLAGFFQRPPVWVQKAGMEWFYRLAKEPQRLWKRYLIGNVQFAETVLAQSLRGRMGTTANLAR